MTLKRLSKRILSIPMIGLLFTAIHTTTSHAGAMGPESLKDSGKAYAGLFGGGGSSYGAVGVDQYGTAYFGETLGGPLAVNAFGKANARSVGIIGGQVGYQWMEMTSHHMMPWSLSPAVEIEGYYLGKSAFSSNDINNETDRLMEHNFLLKLPMSSGVFLVNAVLNGNRTQSRVHPYIGGGIGLAVNSVTNATSTQISPAEPGVNHFNSQTNSTSTTFATQGKAGLNVDVNQHVSIFAEYRGLYTASANYLFGSTIALDHVQTSAWQVNIGSQYYNLGALGLRYAA